MSDTPWPTELRLNSAKDRLHISFDDGTMFNLRAEYLRVESPSAEVQGHGAGQKKIELGKEGVTITGLEPVGNYAVRIVFDDGHNTGLYSWAWLHKLATQERSLWAAYVEAATALKMQEAP